VAPAITVQPTASTVTAGQAASFSVTATGTAPLTYQWRKDGIALSGATSATFTLATTSASDAGTYSVVVTNSAGSVTSTGAALTVNAAPVAPAITVQPTASTVTAGQAASFSVTATGTAPLTYQWRKDGIALSGATSATFTLATTSASDAGTYSVVVTNSAGSATSSGAALTVNAAPVAPAITVQPVASTVTAGQAASFSVTATGTAPLTYQWRRDGVALSGATSATFTLATTSAGDAGIYSVVVTNSAGSATSSGAALTVNAAPVAPAITVQPVASTVTAGQAASISVTATGTAPLTYQWRKDGVALSGATSATFTLATTSASDAGTYSVVVTNSAGSVTSSGVALTVNAAPVPPAITVQPVASTVTTGQAVTFSVTATGTAPLAYQWRKDGIALSGATSATFTLTTTSAGDAGTYSVVVTNSAGSATSTGAALTVTLAPVAPAITVQPAASTVTAGQAASFSVTATGTAPLTYQWRKDGVALSGATSATFTLATTSASDAGTYSVVVTNGAGSVTSTGAALTVNAAPVAPAITVQPAASTVTAGQAASFSVTAMGTAPLTYQWRKDGVALSGATSAIVTLATTSASDAGTYSVVVTNGVGSVTSSGAALTVSPPKSSRIANVSIRATLKPRQTLIVGLTMNGGLKPVLMRAVGPGLGAFGVANAMPDPDLALFSSESRVVSNDNWGGGADLVSAAASVGAFPLAAASKDAAALRSFSGGHTLHVQGVDGGNVLVEAYDAGTGDSPRLINVSARNYAGVDGDVLIAGFTVFGNAPKRVLIRAVGPTLGEFGVLGVIADPKLEVYQDAARVAENDNWAASLAPAFGSVGAFQLTPGSRDAAIELTLSPGGYTVHVSPASGSPGEALIEIYELQ
jgi:hypothetical protein